MSLFDDRQPIDEEQPLDDIADRYRGKIIFYGIIGVFASVFAVWMTFQVITEAVTADPAGFEPGQAPTVLGAVGLSVAVWVCVGLVLRGTWLGFQSSRGRETGNFITERVGWVIVAGWGVPLTVATVRSVSWAKIVAEPMLVVIFGLLFAFIIAAPFVGRSLDKQG